MSTTTVEPVTPVTTKDVDFTAGITDSDELRALAMHFTRQGGCGTTEIERGLMLTEGVGPEAEAAVRDGINAFIRRCSAVACANRAAWEKKNAALLKRHASLRRRAAKVMDSDDGDEVRDGIKKGAIVSRLTKPCRITETDLNLLEATVKVVEGLCRPIRARRLEQVREELRKTSWQYIKAGMSRSDVGLIEQKLPENAEWKHIDLLEAALARAAEYSGGEGDGREYGQRLGNRNGRPRGTRKG